MGLIMQAFAFGSALCPCHGVLWYCWDRLRTGVYLGGSHVRNDGISLWPRLRRLV